ncbi:MAG: lectin-like protein [Chitinophagaceae bacterium]
MRQPLLIAQFFFIVLLLITGNDTIAQKGVSVDAKTRLRAAYLQIKKPEMSFEKFAELNSHVYANQNNTLAASGPGLLAPQDLFCGKVRSYCTNGDFESGLDQTQYSGSYGFYSADLYPNPFNLTNGFLSGSLTSSAAHQTIVQKSAGNDPASGIALVAANGGNQSLRLGNAVNGSGTEVLAKTITVDANESILSFYYALVLQDPGHSHDDQPAFSVRAYDCATGLELPNVCNLGNGSNIAVADAGDPFFQSKIYQSELLVYRDWSLAQVNLSAYVGKNVTIVFTNKDCNLSGHFGYAYLDNLFSGQCPVGGIITNQGSITLNNAQLDSCGTGSICTKYSLPYTVNGGITTTGDITISLNIYQNNAFVKTISSPKLTTQPADSSYCFPIDPATLGINLAAGGFDYTVTAALSQGGFALPVITIGNPGTGQRNGLNNDYLVACTSGCNVKGTIVSTNETDNNSDGTVTITGANGTAPYSFVLNGVSSTTGMYTGLSAGTYAYSVTDANNCTSSGTTAVGKTVSGGSGGSDACPADSTIIVNGGTCTTVINWTIPSKLYPDTIPVAGGTTLASGALVLKGIYNGHGYYQSDDSYAWPAAKIASAAVNGHLVTITDAAESDFIKAQLPQPDFGAWIGLYNTGSVGSFAWVTGEALSFTDWNYMEPNNENGTATTVNEPYVHIRGAAPNDKWNDASVNWNLQFMAEYDNPVLTYTQTSGPVPGSTVGAGEYTICYDIKNNATGTTTSCCFKITVLCNSTASACPNDTTITSTSADCSAVVKWMLPTALFPDSIGIAGGTTLADGALLLKGVYNGHGYYQSNDAYAWNDAKTAASAVTGHLVTITDAGESDFIKASLPQPDFGAWIGLYNTGTPGSFAWVTGETVAFTDWNYMEPNNQNGTATTVNEPYVHIRGVAPNDRWNDASANWNFQFIAEFDNPVLTYTQVSGIAYGSVQAPGVYPICYEITNTITGVKTTCCFKVTVACSPAPAAARITGINSRGTAPAPDNVAGTASSRLTAQGFAAIVFPNPSRSNTAFSIRTQSDNNAKVSIKVFDMMGRIVEAKPGVAANSTITIGSNYRPGMYFVQVVQGRKAVSLRLTKQ